METEKKENLEEKKIVETSGVVLIDGIEYETYDSHVFNGCLKLLNNKLKDTEICFENMMTIVKHAMEIVEITKKKGEEQKKLAISLTKKIIVDSPISDAKEKLLLDMINMGLLSSTMDLIVAASRGELDINVIKKTCMSSCFPFLK